MSSLSEWNVSKDTHSSRWCCLGADRWIYLKQLKNRRLKVQMQWLKHVQSLAQMINIHISFAIKSIICRDMTALSKNYLYDFNIVYLQWTICNIWYKPRFNVTSFQTYFLFFFLLFKFENPSNCCKNVFQCFCFMWIKSKVFSWNKGFRK